MMKKLITLLDRLPHPKIWYVFLTLVSSASVIDLPGAPMFGLPELWQIIYIISVGFLKASFIVLFTALMWKYRTTRILALILLIIYTLAAVVNAGAFAFYGFGITRKLIGLLAQTTRAEASEFLPDVYAHLLLLIQSGSTWLLIGAIAIIGFIFFRLSDKAAILLSGCMSVVGFIFFLWMTVAFSTGRTAGLLSVRLPKYFIEQYKSNSHMQALLQRKTELPHPETVKSDHLATNLIVIVGESANMANLSLYGFPLPTSPYMDAMADSLFIFTDAIASSQITSSNIERILTFKPDDQTDGDWYNYPTVIDLFNTAGYRTYWLSNQERVGAWSNGAGAIASGADVMSFIGLEYCDDSLLGDRTYDEDLLPHFHKALADSGSPKLIWLHLMGSHTIYSKRYPRNRNHFSANDVIEKVDRPWLNSTGAQLLADYSNSLLYTDSIWHETIRTTGTLEEPSIVIYLSDHGENVCLDNNMRGRDNRSVRIPFVIYANKAYLEKNPEIGTKLRSSINRPFSSASLIHILMTLTGTDYDLYNGNDDPLSDTFSPRIRFVDEEPWEEGITVKSSMK